MTIMILIITNDSRDNHPRTDKQGRTRRRRPFKNSLQLPPPQPATSIQSNFKKPKKAGAASSSQAAAAPAMSWLARSIANTLRLDDDDDDADDVVRHQHEYDGGVIDNPRQQHLNNVAQHHTSVFLHSAESLDLEEVDLEDRPGKSSSYHQSSDNNVVGDDNGNFEDEGDRNMNYQGRGVKEDLSEFTETLTRQLWGVASFLAPSPPPPPPPPPPRPLPRPRSFNWLESDRRRTELAKRSGSGDEEGSDEEMDGQFGQFRGFPQSFLEVGMPEEEEEEEEEDDLLGDAVGITEEALDFAENTAHHPETWLNFPLSEEEEFDDFEISDLQFKHARAIEHLAPRLAALRRELCPAHMTEGYFWMVYFVLLHSRLDKHDVDLLSTPQLVKARTMWMHELQKQTKPESQWLGRDTYDLEEKNYFPCESFDVASCEDKTPRFMSHMAFHLDSTASQVTSDSEPEKHPLDKTGHEENLTSTKGNELLSGPPHRVPIEEYDEHEDDWLDDDSELEGYAGTAITLVNEEDVSFSDLEDDLDTVPIKSKVLVKD